MIPAIAGEPAQTLHQLRCQLYATRIDLKAPRKNLAAAAVNVEKTAGRLHIEYISPLVFYLFEAAATAFFATAVPICVICSTISHRLFLAALIFCPNQISQRSHSLWTIITLTMKLGQCGFFFCSGTGRTGKSK